MQLLDGISPMEGRAKGRPENFKKMLIAKLTSRLK
jgi:hypothetical protein